MERVEEVYISAAISIIYYSCNDVTEKLQLQTQNLYDFLVKVSVMNFYNNKTRKTNLKCYFTLLYTGS